MVEKLVLIGLALTVAVSGCIGQDTNSDMDSKTSSAEVAYPKYIILDSSEKAEQPIVDLQYEITCYDFNAGHGVITDVPSKWADDFYLNKSQMLVEDPSKCSMETEVIG